MDKKQITSVVDGVITEAGKAKGWSLAKLTRYLGKGSNTLHRWKTGQTTAYDMEALVELFKMAGTSMDQAFGLVSADEEASQAGAARYQALRNDVDRIDLELAHLRPLARMAAAISAVITAMSPTGAAGRDELVPADQAQGSPAAAGQPTAQVGASRSMGKSAAKAPARRSRAPRRKS